jgi:WD domain, G-beta repeat
VLPLTRQAAIALRGDPDTGIARLRRLAAAGHPQACRQLAVWLARSGQVDELRERVAAGDRFARRALSDLLVGQRSHDEAIEVLRPLAGDHDGSRRRLARLLAGRGRVDEAAALLAGGPAGAVTARTVTARTVTARTDGRRIARWLGSQGRAERLRALAAGGDDAAAEQLHTLVLSWWTAGRLAEAIPLLARLHLPEDGRLVLAARDRWRSGRRLPLRDRAIALLDGVEDPLCRRTRARLLRLQGRHAAAAAAFTELADAGDTLAADELATAARRLPVPRELPTLPYLPGGHVRSVGYGPDGLIAGAPTGGVLLWGRGGVPRRLDLGHGGFAVSPDGSLLARANGLWRLPGGEHECELVPRTPTDRAVAFSPDGRLVASGQLWEVSGGAHLGRLTRAWARAVAFSSDGDLVAVASTWPIGVRVRRVPSREPVRTLQTLANALAFQPGGPLLATAGDDAVRLWGGAADRPERVLAGGAEGLAFSPDGTLLATVRREGWRGAGVRLWRPDTGELVWTIDLGADAVAFSPDGTELATASDADAVLRCWDVAALLA